MKSETSKLLLGLGLGAVVGVAVGYLLTGDNRKKLEEDLNHVGHGIKDGVKSAFTKVKSKAEEAGSHFAGKAGEWSEKAGEKAEEWANEAANRASGVADNFSQKANDLRNEMDSKAQTDSDTHDKYAQNFRQDMNGMKDNAKNEK